MQQRNRRMILGVALVATATVAWAGVRYLRSPGRLFVNPACDTSGRYEGRPMRFGQPLCAMLVLDDKVTERALVDVELYRTSPAPDAVGGGAGERRMENSFTFYSEVGDDELHFRSPDVERLVAGRPGSFELRFVRGGIELASAAFSVQQR